MSIHSQNEDVILQFGLKKPAFRICVNTPTTHGSIGLTTGLDPAMTLGCGGWGGNITSDNISPRHLLNIKRLAYELRPAVRLVAACRRQASRSPAESRPQTGAVELSAPESARGAGDQADLRADARRQESTAFWRPAAIRPPDGEPDSTTARIGSA